MLIVLAACAPEGGPPRVEAFGGGRGYWPVDSRTAVEGALALEFDAIELGVVLTADRVPVLWHDPVLYGGFYAEEMLVYGGAVCTTADGERIAEDWVPIRDLAFEELLAGYRCGGLPDRRFDQALVVEEPILALDELLELLREARSDLLVDLYVVHERGFTPGPAALAAAILDRWIDADLPQDLVVSTGSPAVVEAFEAHGRARAFDVVTSLYPVPDPLVLEAQRLTSQLDYAAMARDVGADGVTLLWETADPLLVRAARREGTQVRIALVDHPRARRDWTRPGLADALLTDFPGDFP